VSIEGKRSAQGRYLYRNRDLEVLRYNPRRKSNRVLADEAYGSRTPTKFPLNVIIEPTNHCNMMCQMCLRNVMTRPKGFMDWDTYQKIIDECAANNTYSLSLYMLGDPLMHSRIRDMVNYAKRMGIPYVDISSNGLIDMTCLLGTALDELIISLDGIDNDSYNANRQGDYQKIENNIINLMEMKARGNYEYPLVRLQIIDMESTRPYLEQFVDKWMDKVDVIYIKKLEGMVQGLGDKLVSNEELAAINLGRQPCKQLFFTHSINWNGDHAFCCHDPHSQTILGNVREMTIKEAWDSKLKASEVERQKNGSYTGICEKCVDWGYW